jgi:glycosyltransferase involved in cell wall biosynthesis
VRAARRLDGRSLIYHCVDHYAANPGVDRARVEAAEGEMLAAADRVFAASAELAAHLRRRRPDAIALPNVADVALFGRAVGEPLPEPAALAGVPRPRAVYVGNLAAYRVDFALLREAGQALSDVQWVLLGAVGLGDPAGAPSAWRELVALPNVHAFGPELQEALPAWLRHADVALIPFLDNEHTRGSLPLKLWEYLAAGLPVVATDLPNFAELAGEGTIRTASGAVAFAAAVRAALAEPPERRAERLERARAHDWGERIDELSRLLAEEPGGGGGVR